MPDDINDQEQLRLHVLSHDGISFIPDAWIAEISQSTLAATDDIYIQEMISSCMSCYIFHDFIRLQTDDPHINKVIVTPIRMYVRGILWFSRRYAASADISSFSQ